MSNAGKKIESKTKKQGDEEIMKFEEFFKFRASWRES